MNLIAFDVETYSTVPAYGLQPWRDDFRIRSFAWSDASAARVIRDPSIDDLRQFLRDCVDTSRYNAMETAWYLCTRGFSSRNIQAAIEGSVERLDRWYERHFQLGKYGYNKPNYYAKCDLV